MSGENLVVVWFSFERDSLTVVESVRAVRAVLPDAALCVVEDAAAPLLAVQRDLLEAGGVEVRGSAFRRGGNLNGAECISGMLAEMEAACERYDRAGAVKVDSDTVILRTEWLDNGARYRGFEGLGGFVVGACYYLEVELLGELLEDCARFSPSPSAEEDYEIWHRASRLIGHIHARNGVVPLVRNEVVGYNWGSDSTAEDYVTNHYFQAVSVGQPGGCTGARCDRIEAEALLMARMITARHG